MDKRPAARALEHLLDRSGLSQTELAINVGMKAYQVSKRVKGTDRIRPAEYALWDRGLKLPSGTFEKEVERQRDLIRAEEDRASARTQSTDTTAATAAIRVVLGEIAPIVAEICQHVEGPERDHMLREVVTFAEGMAAAAKTSARRRGHGAIVLGPPAEDLHGAHRAYFGDREEGKDDEQKGNPGAAGG